VADGTRPSNVQLYGRALVRRCPVCGQGQLFTRWVRMRERCPRCDLAFERVEGHWTGALGINTVVSFGSLLLTMLVIFWLTYPDVPAGLLLGSAVVVAVVVPFAFFPFSKTLWLAIDLQMRPPGPDEVRPPFSW
jgi:uncharacterized protein (DUF983 family)